MARTGVTYSDIAETAAQLEGRGQMATVDNIRQQLGTGSRTTIAHHLKTWKSQKTTISHNEIPHELSSHVKGLWERLHATADNRIEQIEQLMQQKLDELQSQLEHERLDYQFLDTKLRETEARYNEQVKYTEKYREDLSQSDQLNAKLETYSTVVKEQIERLQAENTRLHQINSRLQDNVENIQAEWVKSQHDHQQSMENDRNIFVEQIQQLKQSHSDLIDQVKQLEIEKIHLISERDSLQDNIASINQNNAQEKSKTSELLQDLFNLQIKHETLAQELNLNKQEMKDKSLTIIDLERKNAVVSEQVFRLKNAMQELEISKQQIVLKCQYLSQENANLHTKLLQCQ